MPIRLEIDSCCCVDKQISEENQNAIDFVCYHKENKGIFIDRERSLILQIK